MAQMLPMSLIEQARWCFRRLRECTDPEMKLELAFIGATLLTKARRQIERAEPAR